ncbi:Fic family protein [Vibrio sp. MA40-2]|uniref:Fic family protein n=1 Tax=Vibrio sp. MA40-2 TaxID=3391828 RepID=UPI0039A475FD
MKKTPETTENQRVLKVDDAESRFVHIKSSRRNENYCRVYWNKRNSSIYTQKSVSGAVARLDELTVYEEDFRDKIREVQVGDSVCYIFGIKHIPLFFCSITGKQIHTDGEVYVYLEPNSSRSTALPTWKKFEPDRFIFISDNRLGTLNEMVNDPNLVFAECREELDIAEEIYAENRVPKFLQEHVEDDSLPIGESTFKQCHKILFEGIYDWAGVYRNEELVVQNDRRPTLTSEKVSEASKEFFSSLTRSQLRKVTDKDTLIKMIIDTHRELAWIHPFKDGNGRAIRLFLELLCLTRGYKFNLESFLETSKGKKSYYYAVRQSLAGQHAVIRRYFEKATNEL